MATSGNFEIEIARTQRRKLDSESFRICITYFATLFGLGLQISAVGPILKDIQQQVSLDLGTVSYIFSARAIGYVIGSMIAGYIIDKYQKIVSLKSNVHILLKIKPHQIFFMCVFIANISMMIVPFLNDFVLILILFIITGLTYGQVDTYANVFILALFDTEDENDASVKPYMQFLHFTFAIGAFIAPLLIQLSFHLTNHYALAIIIFGVLNIVTASPLLCQPTPIRKNTEEKHKNHSNNNSFTQEMEMGRIDDPNIDDDDDTIDEEDLVMELRHQDQSANKKCVQYTIMFIFAVFFAIYVGSEVSYGGYVTTYCINYLNTENSIGRYMSSVFWLGLSIGRLSAVFISNKITTFQMMVIDITGVIVGNFLLIIFSKMVTMTYIASFIYGFGMSSLFPCAFLYGDETIAVTGKFASAMVFGASVGEFVIPTLLGNMMHHIGDRIFEIFMLIMTIIMGSTLAIIVCLRRTLLH